jgi:hypothetical protein
MFGVNEGVLNLSVFEVVVVVVVVDVVFEFNNNVGASK